MTRRVVVILVKGENSTYLMGTRRDNGKINFPAGGVEDQEDPRDAAVRELKEETGFDSKALWPMGCYEELSHDNKPMMIYVYGAEVDGAPNLENDPDQEFQSIYWKNPLTIISTELHIPPHKNSGLKAIVDSLKKK